ncbi:hypothetical protein LSCM1_02328 [Leishmania martiniquensis]|uniref:Cilia- and flagella-associated protein 418 n=1 Tax=Leishmania martiniquensis TaxID=1580590 RepID=A0A836GQY8_9TRYP|nr:hypothetical protein LSCM1_02328 [Leishmania martiniquensis]
MSELDSLIEELFPERKNNGCTPAPLSGPSRRRSEWDDESDDNQEIVKAASAHMHTSVERHPSPALSPARPSFYGGIAGSTSGSIGHCFDDDSDTDNNPAHPTVLRHESREQARSEPNVRPFTGVSKPLLFPVPFPSLSDSKGSYACASRCYLTNLGVTLCSGAGHPTLQQLRAIAADEHANVEPSRTQAMLQKGAFHAAIAKLGNGCLDHHGDYTGDGGCPHILCRKCNYMVVRLQNAEWDAEGGVNLYLTLRNFYPDWCRLASATPVGVENGAEAARFVLRTRSSAAAYCCQCSWVTVSSAKVVIETRLTDIVVTKTAREEEHPFATELPLPPSERRRPPLWVCHGHTR